MKAGPCVLLVLLLVCVGNFLIGKAHGQSTERATSVPPRLTCSPAPCVLPPTQASEGGSIVTDTPIVTNPLNPKHLLLGSVDGNCGGLGFHLSSDGGSTWKVGCMLIYHRTGQDEPHVGYDRKGTAYISGTLFSQRGPRRLRRRSKINRRNPLEQAGCGPACPWRQPAYTRLTVDTNVGSHRVNSLYVSGVMELAHGNTQVLVSHSNDGGATWTQAAVDPVQKYPEEDHFTRMAVGKDGTVYATGCAAGGRGGRERSCPTAHMMFSKSTDGGNTLVRATANGDRAKMPHYWRLPNTEVSGCTTIRQS